MTDDFSGRLLGRYRVLSLLGRGGMGAVYRARDESLGRDVAVKILPPELTSNATRIERFVQEARAASALNHPHLTSVYEIGTEPVHYIAMELVQGRTLRSVLDGGRPDLKHALEWIAQVVDALAAAHEAGVVHRDVKPENLMIADSGYAKVLDFGVAKLRADHENAATQVALTDVGALVGTSGYMSPEQARGAPTDTRTDVFAIGSVLYECITGRAAFAAPSAVERLHRVIHDEPAPMEQVAPSAPTALLMIVRKCLAKDPDERYQSMRELGIDVRRVRRELDATASPAAAVPVPQRAGYALWMTLAVTAAALVALAVYFRTGDAGPAVATPPALSIARLTSSGNTITATISPDGKHLTHVEAVGAAQSLWVRNLETGEDREVAPPGSGAFYGAVFSPDGQSLFYTTRGIGHSGGRLNVMPRGGGDSRPVLNTILTPVTFSPDGRQLAFLRERYPDQDSSALVVANADGTGERVLATRRAPQSFTPTFFTNASWSPDGSAIVATDRNEEAQRSRLLLFDVATGAERELHGMTGNMTFTMWLPDSTGIVFVLRSFLAYSGLAGQIWMQPYPAGAPRRITNDLLDYRSVSMTNDGHTLVAVGAEYESSLYVVPLDGQEPRRISSNRYEGLDGMAPLADGSLIVASTLGNKSQIARLTPAAGTRTMLTTEGGNMEPAVSPDGRTIAMVSDRDGLLGVWRMNIDGTDQRLLAHLPAVTRLSFTPDGRQIICTSTVAARISTWSVPVEGGQPREVIRQMDRAVVSPDGKWLAGIYLPAGLGDNSRSFAAVVPLDGSLPLRSLGVLVPATTTGVLTWNQDGTALIATTSERFNLWLYPLTGEGPRRLTDLTERTFIHGRLMSDGQSIIAARGVFHRDAFAIKDFQ